MSKKTEAAVIRTLRREYENCRTGFCRHCGWINTPAAFRRDLAKATKPKGKL